MEHAVIIHIHSSDDIVIRANMPMEGTSSSLRDPDSPHLIVLHQVTCVFENPLSESGCSALQSNSQLFLMYKILANRFGYRVDPKPSLMLAYPSMVNYHKHKSKQTRLQTTD